MSNLKKMLHDKILANPNITEKFWPSENGGFTSFVFNGKEFAHFHTGNELDLKLGKKIIASENLSHPTSSTVHPNRQGGSPWIELHFNTESEVDHIVRLIDLAIKQI